MLNEEKIKIMNKLAMYEQGEGKKYLPVSRYYRSDYIGLAMIKNFFLVTIGYCLILAGIAAYFAEYLIGFSEIAGAGRNKRKAKVSELNNIRILADTSAVELYLNDGEIVFSTRYYPDHEDLQLKVKGGKFRGNLWNLRKMIFTK